MVRHPCPRPKNGDSFLFRALDCINCNLADQEFNVMQLSESLGMSRSQLYRKILAGTACTPRELIRDVRLCAAERMLAEGESNVTRTMYESGFSSPAYFARSFRERYGVNPSSYLARARRKKILPA